MINSNQENKPKSFINRLYDSGIGEFLKLITGNIQKLQAKIREERNLELRLNNLKLEKKKDISLKEISGNYNPLNDFHNHESLNPACLPTSPKNYSSSNLRENSPHKSLYNFFR